MKHIIRFVLVVFILFAVILLKGVTKKIDITYDDAVHSFQEYEIAVNNFFENPSKENLIKASKSGSLFFQNYHDLENHQTLYNQLFKNEPILAKDEMTNLIKLKKDYDQIDKQYVETALKEVYDAADFSPFVNQILANGTYENDIITMEQKDKFHYVIEVDGTFHFDNSTNVASRYFFIKTEKGNYYWQRPNNYSIAKKSDEEAVLKFDRKNFTINGSVKFAGF